MEYKLSASLEGHEEDVRAVAFPDPSFVLSASRDATVRLWKLLSQKPPTYDCTIASHGTSFINALAFVPPSSAYPDGLIISGGKDAIIEVRQPGKAPQDNADALLLGHAGNVCALDVSEDGQTVVSGSWDSEAKVWQIGKWDTAVATLQGHDGSVWTVLAYDKETIITGCADKLIRIFHPSGRLKRTVRGSTDVVRALCRLSPDHSSGAQFASAGNDSVIRLWTMEGLEVAQLHGHENFIYSIASSPDGNLVSSSEDRTVRIWQGNQCIQTITHPAISVWSVAVCAQNEDIVTGASDRIVRVFSRSTDRQADAAVLQAYEESVKASAIPEQAIGEINKHDLPGPEFLQRKSGTKEGQVQMIKEHNGSVTAHTWSTAAQQWVNVGTVVDSAGSSGGRKITYNGKDYDYVFDVDIKDDAPPLKLPYNATQNPYEAARKFIEDNELPLDYLDQVANFIVQNTQGASIGQRQGGLPDRETWGSEARYRPGDVGSAPSQTTSRPKVLPQTQYLSIATAQYKNIEKKIQEFNQQLLNEGRKDVSLNPSGLEALAATIKQLESSSSKQDGSTPILPQGIDIAITIITSWPADKRLPGYDLLRVLAAASSTTVEHTSATAGQTLVEILASTDVFSTDAPVNNTMLAVRTLANLFMSDAGRTIMDGEWETVHTLVQPLIGTSNRNLIVAIATLYINYAVLLSAGGDTTDVDRAMTLLQELLKVVGEIKDSEGLYRALVGVGTLVALGRDFRDAIKRAGVDVEAALKRAEKVGVEPRIKNVVKEIRDEIS